MNGAGINHSDPERLVSYLFLTWEVSLNSSDMFFICNAIRVQEIRKRIWIVQGRRDKAKR